MKTAITITIDLKCAQKVKEQSLKASTYINNLIIDDMVGDLKQSKLPAVNPYAITGRCPHPGQCFGTEHFSNEINCHYCGGEL